MSNFNKNTGQLTIDQYLPHNYIAEKIILSSVIINPEALEIVFRSLTVETFYFQNHQELYKIIIEMYTNQIPIDAVTLNTFLQDKGKLETIGGTKILIDLLNSVPNLIYLEQYINLLQDKFLRRSIIKLGYELINSAYITNISLDTILNDLEHHVFNLTTEIKSQKISSSAELLSTIFVDLKKKSISPSLSGISSGFYDLDSFTQGFQKSDLIVLAGRPSMGKTALSLNICLNIIKNLKLPVLFLVLKCLKSN